MYGPNTGQVPQTINDQQMEHKQNTSNIWMVHNKPNTLNIISFYTSADSYKTPLIALVRNTP